jgi:uncharacterized protein YcbK (DUF882 family)
MIRAPLFGVAFLLAAVWGSGVVFAEQEAEAQAHTQTAGPPAGEAARAEDAAAATAAGESGDDTPSRASRKHRRRSKGGRRRGLFSGRVVPEEKLRQEPVGRPSGDLHIVSINSGEEANVNIYNEDGSYDIDALAELDHIMRCRRTDAEKPMDPQLLMLLSHVYDHFGRKPLEIVSGYRNQRKQTSNHYKGTASDIRIAGVSPRKIEAFAETLDRGGMGIGLYPRSAFVHIDVRSPPSYRWLDYSPPNPDAAEKRPPRGWKRKKLQS